MFAILIATTLFMIGLASMTVAHGLWLEGKGHNQLKFKMVLGGLISLTIAIILTIVYYPLPIPSHWKVIFTVLVALFIWDILRLRIAAGHPSIRSEIIKRIWVKHVVSGMYRNR